MELNQKMEYYEDNIGLEMEYNNQKKNLTELQMNHPG